MEPDKADSNVVINKGTKKNRPFFKKLFLKFLQKLSVGKLILQDKDETAYRS